jgi:hypothetical protein
MIPQRFTFGQNHSSGSRLLKQHVNLFLCNVSRNRKIWGKMSGTFSAERNISSSYARDALRNASRLSCRCGEQCYSLVKLPRMKFHENLFTWLVHANRPTRWAHCCRRRRQNGLLRGSRDECKSVSVFRLSRKQRRIVHSEVRRECPLSVVSALPCVTNSELVTTDRSQETKMATAGLVSLSSLS